MEESSSKLSDVAQGKQREVGIQAPTIIIFLPRSLRRSCNNSLQAGLLLGWCFKAGPTDDKLIIVVAGLISHKEMVLAKISPATDTENREAHVIGNCRMVNSNSSIGSSYDRLSKSSMTWLEVGFRKDASRRQSSLTTTAVILGVRAQIKINDSIQCAIDVITYTTPRSERMKFLSLEPMILPMASSAGILDRANAAKDDAKDAHLQQKLEALTRLDPMRYQDLSSRYLSDRGPGQGFRKAINLLNECSYLNERLANTSSSTTIGIAKSEQSIASIAFFASARSLRSPCQRLKSVMHSSLRGLTLCEISATARQLDLRLGQLNIWPSLGYQLRIQRRKDQEPVSNLAPRYIALYNGVWLVINDVILGQAAGVWICENYKGISRFLSQSLSPILVHRLISALDWLDDWPAGLKLNTQLSHFFRDMYVGLATGWDDSFLSQLTNDANTLDQFIYHIGLCSRFLGLTMLLSIVIDVLELLTLHWRIFYKIQQVIFSFFCSSIIALFHLFRGKKRNPLRKNRIDQATYELDQLLLGTIFFTLFVFLWLTVAIYYLQFSLLRLALVGIIVVLQTILAFLNHLPLFALMLRIKEPDRLPGGVELRHIDVDPEHNSFNCSYFELYNTPLGVQDIFRGYNGHLQSIRDLPHLLWNLVIGRKF